MSAKKNTLQLPPQFHSTSASESKSETKINLIKTGKYIMYNNNIQTDFMRAIMILSSHFYLWKLEYKKDSIIAWPGRFTFPCMSLRLFSLLYEYLISPAIINVITTFSYLNCYLYFPWL